MGASHCGILLGWINGLFFTYFQPFWAMMQCGSMADPPTNWPKCIPGNQTWQWTILYLSMFLLTSMPTMPIDRAFQASNPPPKGPCFVLGLQSPTSLREWQQWLSGTVFCDGDATDLGVPWEVQGTKQWSFNGHRNKASLSGWVWWNMGNSRISQPCWDPGT